ncbi:MAG TPA: hypothetical protein VI759_10845 [Dehalococcoidia bacterium]|nr:hypothetical protein [Dehalococcoidia bacterium]
MVFDIGPSVDEAKAFYGTSINFDRVTFKASGLVFGPGTAWTANNTVRFKQDAPPSTSTLIHELGHVWEHQNGQTQLLKGFLEQALRALSRGKYDPYDFGGPAAVRAAVAAGRRLQSFNKEGQAQIIQERWKSQNGFAADRMGNAFTAEYVDDLGALVQAAGIGGALVPATLPTVVTFLMLPIDSTVAMVVNLVLGIAGLFGLERRIFA